MGPKQTRTSESMLMDNYLLESFKDTELEFPLKEITKLKVRFKDAENYFNSKFDYLLFFNNFIFHEGLSTLYDNYISKIEDFTSKNKLKNKLNKNKFFYLFVDFDDENKAVSNGSEIEFDSLYTIVFEKLEIQNIVYFSLLNANKDYLRAFFEQFYENVYLYKTNRNFDALYFLLPDAEFLIKNENYVIYIGNKNNYIKPSTSSTDFGSNFMYGKIKAKYSKIIFNSLYFKELVAVSYNYTPANKEIFTFLSNIHNCCFIKSCFDITIDDNDPGVVLTKFEKIWNVQSFLANKCGINQFFFFLEKDSQLTTDLGSNYLELLFKKLFINQEKSEIESNFQRIKMINFISERRENYTCVFGKLDKLIHMVINNSFTRSAKIRKVVVEYYEVYRVKSSNSQTLSKRSEIGDISKRENLNDSAENITSKNKTIYYYSIEKIQYEWFVPVNLLEKIKIYFLYLFKKSSKEFYTELQKNSYKIMKDIFKYLWDSNLKSYFICKRTVETGKKSSQTDFEKNFFL